MNTGEYVSAGEQTIVGTAGVDFDIRGLFKKIRRYALSASLVAVLLFGVVIAVAYVLPSVYEASATILVVSQEIPSALAASTVTVSADERLQLIQQRLMTRDNLLSIAKQYSLYQKPGREVSPSDIVDEMRLATAITQIDLSQTLQSQSSSRALQPSSNKSGQQTIGFTVSFDYGNPEIASRVTNEFVSSILKQNIETRTGRASETSKFFEAQVSSFAQALAANETKIAEFKKTNEAALPESLAYRRSQVAVLQTEVNDLDQNIAQIDNPQHVATQANLMQSIKDQLASLQSQLNSVSDQYDEMKPLADKGFIARNRVKELARSVEVLRTQVQSASDRLADQTKLADGEKAQVVSFKTRRADLVTRMAELNDAIAKTPQVELVLNTLERDRDNVQTQYQQAKSRMAEAAIGQQLEEDRQAERFEVIEQASAPIEPIRPKRLKIILAGAFGSVAAGAGFSLLRQLLDRSIKGRADLERRLQIRPLSVIPYVVTQSERRRRRWKRWVIFAGIVAIIATALTLVHIYYFPLNLLIGQWASDLGIWRAPTR